LPSDLDLPTPPPEVVSYLRRTGHTFTFEYTFEDGFVVAELDRNNVKIATRVLGRFPTEPPVQFVVDAMRGLAGVGAA
jgi:hypothetical protein